MNIHIFSGIDPLVVFTKASILMNCNIQTMCVKTNVRVSYTPPEVMVEDCLKILYYHHQNVTMCQRVVDIRMNEGNMDVSKQMQPDFSEVCIQQKGFLNYKFRDYFVVYGYDSSQGIHEIEIYTSLTVLQKFENFFEKIPPDSSLAFIFNRRDAPFIPLFVKSLLGHLGRKPPIDAKCSQDIQTWLSNNEPRRDLIAHASTLSNMKTQFIINLSPKLSSNEQMFTTRNATSQYSHIYLPTSSPDELEAMKFLSSEKYQQSDEEYPIHRSNMEKYLRRKFGDSLALGLKFK